VELSAGDVPKSRDAVECSVRISLKELGGS